MSRKVRLVHRGRDQVTMELPILDTDGKPKRNAAGRVQKETIVFGSTDDEGVVGTAQPEIELPTEKWERLLKQKAVAGMVKKRQIAVYQAA